MPSKKERSNISLIQELGIDSKKRYIYLTPNSECDEIDSKMMYSFIQNLHYLDSLDSKPIVIWSACIGGDVSYGFAMYDAIKNSNSPTIFISTGIAASMGTIIQQAATLRLITPNTNYLIHEGYIGLDDSEPKNAFSAIKSMKISVNKFYEVYKSRCKDLGAFKGKSEKYIVNYLKKQIKMHGDWYLEPNEIISLGFADGIFGEKDYKNIEDTIKSVYSKMDSNLQYQI